MKLIRIIFLGLVCPLVSCEINSKSILVEAYENSIIKYFENKDQISISVDTELSKNQLPTELVGIEITYLDKKNLESVSQNVKPGEEIYTIYHDDSKTDTVLIYFYSETFTGMKSIEDKDSIPELIDIVPSQKTHDGLYLIWPMFEYIFEHEKNKWVLYGREELILKDLNKTDYNN